MPIGAIFQSLSRSSTKLPGDTMLSQEILCDEHNSAQNPLLTIAKTAKHPKGRSIVSNVHESKNQVSTLERAGLAFAKVVSRIRNHHKSRIDPSRVHRSSIATTFLGLEKGLDEMLPIISGRNRRY